MKIVIIFALIGLSLCQEKYTCSEELKSKAPKECFKQAIKNGQALTHAVNEMICRFKENKEQNRRQIFDNFEEAVQNIVNCSSCGFGNFIGMPQIVPKYANPMGAVAAKIVELMEGLIETMGFANILETTMCNTAGAVLVSSCVQNMLMHADEFLQGLEGNLCANKLDLMALLALMQKYDCFVQKGLNMNLLTQGPLSIVTNAVTPLVMQLGTLIGSIPEVDTVVLQAGCKLVIIAKKTLNGATFMELFKDLLQRISAGGSSVATDNSKSAKVQKPALLNGGGLLSGLTKNLL